MNDIAKLPQSGCAKSLGVKEEMCAYQDENNYCYWRDIRVPQLEGERDAALDLRQHAIATLDADLARVRGALEKIRDEVDHVGKDHAFSYCNEIARAALEDR